MVLNHGSEFLLEHQTDLSGMSNIWWYHVSALRSVTYIIAFQVHTIRQINYAREFGRVQSVINPGLITEHVIC